jgi:hypothetical protein
MIASTKDGVESGGLDMLGMLAMGAGSIYNGYDSDRATNESRWRTMCLLLGRLRRCYRLE